MLIRIKMIFMILLFAMGWTLNAQESIESANKKYELQAFNDALDNYNQLLVENPSCLECQLKVADIYRVLRQPKKAKVAYEKAMLTESLKGKYLLGYGHTLKALGNYEDAKNIYREVAQTDPVVGDYFAKSCDVALSYKGGEVTYIERACNYNSIMSDKGLTLFNGNLILTSFSEEAISSHNEDWLDTDGTLMFSSCSSNSSPEKLRNAIGVTTNINAISYAADNSFCVLSKTTNSTNESPVMDNESAKALYISNKVSSNGNFDEVVAFDHNQVGSSSTHPTISKDGERLYFSSNREGGLGGFDIYVSNLENNVWSEPINLGAPINTPGNEITPSISIKGTLAYASDYLEGLGGYDIFRTQYENDSWTTPVNPGVNVNSSRDDYMPVLDFSGDIAYVTSNREGTLGGSDIYQVELLSTIPREAMAINESSVIAEDVEEFEDDLNAEPIFVMNEELEFDITEIETIDVLDIQEVDYIADESARPKAFVIPEYKSSELDRDPNLKSVSFVDEKSFPANAYFVQIASISNFNGDLSVYKKASTQGNVYKIFKSGLIKIRVGYYGDESQARNVLRKLKSEGFSDAFITNDNLDMGEIELIYSNFDNNYVDNNSNSSYQEDTDSAYNSIPHASDYKVRLAAYDNPLFFDVAAVKGIAKLEQWSKGDWTIFLLGGFKSLEEAEQAKIKAINRGFIDAYLVVDKGGVLEKLVKN